MKASTHKVDVGLCFAHNQEVCDPKGPSHCYTIFQRVFLPYLQAGGGERLHDPPQVHTKLLDAATHAAPSKHERVRLRGIGFEVPEMGLGARALLVPGLRGRETRG